jgi:hypothetical protein
LDLTAKKFYRERREQARTEEKKKAAEAKVRAASVAICVQAEELELGRRVAPGVTYVSAPPDVFWPAYKQILIILQNSYRNSML